MARNILIISSKIITNVPILRKHSPISNKNVPFVMIHFLNILRDYSNTNRPEETFKEIPLTSLKEYKTKHSPGIKFITPKLQHLLELSPIEVKDLLKKYPKLKNVSPESLENNYNLFINAGITQEVLLQYPALLSTENINYKIKNLQELDVDINLIAPVMLSSVKTLKRIVEDAKIEENNCPTGNRIVHLSNLLNLPTTEVAEKIINHTYVLRIPLDRLESILKVLLAYGVEPRNILNDCWALRYSPLIAEERLERAINANVLKVKTWMIRCTDKVFERCINRQIENRKILGSNSTVDDYLSKRLECSLENAKFLTEKYPAIMKMSILKMKEILDFLYEQGYTPVHVCRVPRILIHSLETTKLRIQQLKQLGYVPPSLAILCKSKRDFDKILKKYAKRKKTSDIQKQIPDT